MHEGVGTIRRTAFDGGEAAIAAAKAGDDLTVTTAPIALKDWNEPPEPRWWLDLITAHLANSLPLPADPEGRKHLVYRAGLQILGTPLSQEEIDAFVNARDPAALVSLARRLASGPLRPGVEVHEAADLIARLTLSLISSPGGWDMDDPGAVRRLVRGQLLAGVVDLDGGDVG